MNDVIPEHLRRYAEILEGFDAEGRLRHIPGHRNREGVIDLVSNDYMGLRDYAAEMQREFMTEHGGLPLSASASRLLATDQESFESLERFLGELYGRAALLFNSGYHANVGVVGALNVPGTLFAADKMIHASAIDGLTHRDCEFVRWKHNDTASLRRILERNSRKYERIVVMAESIYSMDGDIAPLHELVELRREFPDIILYIDEAHGFGVRGERGLGLCEEAGLIDEIDIIMGTLGKAAASAGAFVITSSLLRSLFINSARSLIFSTSLSPLQAAWSELMVRELTAMSVRRAHLHEVSKRFRDGIERITGKATASCSQIVPLITGDAAKAVELSSRLEKHGILALPIRRPTVPPGGERIRFSLHAGLTEEHIDDILKIIERILQN